MLTIIVILLLILVLTKREARQLLFAMAGLALGLALFAVIFFIGLLVAIRWHWI